MRVHSVPAAICTTCTYSVPFIMASRVEILNEGCYRSDGRRQFELRDMTFDLSSKASTDGSAMVSLGLTQVLVSVSGPREAKNRAQTLHNKANINVEIIFAPFSASERRKRSKNDRRTLELAAAIKSTFEPVVLLHLYPRSQIDIYVQILQQDGSLLSAAINATTLALIISGISLSDYVCAVSAGVHTTHPLLDLTTLEESDVPHLTVATMPRLAKVTLASLETRLHADRFKEIFRLACDAGKVIHEEMLTAVTNQIGALTRALSSNTVIGSIVKNDLDDDNEMHID